MRARLTRWIPSLLSYALLLAVLAWSATVFRHDLGQLSMATLARSWDVVAASALLSLVGYAFRILRWRFYLRRLGHVVSRTAATWIYTAGFAYALSPGKVGEMVRARYCLPMGIPLKDVTAAFVAERLMDLLAMIVLAGGLILSSGRYATLATASAGVALAGLAVLVLVPWPKVQGKLQARVQQACTTRLHLPTLLRKALVGLAATLASTRPLLRSGMLAAGFTAALLAWSMEGLGLNVLGSMFPEIHLSVAGTVGIYATAMIVGAVSFLPGGLGTTEAVMAALLVSAGYPAPDAFLMTLLCRLVTLWLAMALGWAALAVLRYHPPTVEA